MNAAAKLDPNALVRIHKTATSLYVHPLDHPDWLVEISRHGKERSEYSYAVDQLSYEYHGVANMKRRENHITSFGSMREAVACATFIFSRWTDARENDFNVLRRDPLRPMSELKGSPRSRAWLARGWAGSVGAEPSPWVTDGNMAIRASLLPAGVEPLMRIPRPDYATVPAANVLVAVRPYLKTKPIVPGPRVLGFGRTFTMSVAHICLGDVMQHVDAHKLALLLAVLPERATLTFADHVLDPLVLHVDGQLAAILMPIRVDRMGPDIYTASEAHAAQL